MTEQWYEAEITVADAHNNRSTQHIEYQTHAVDVETAAREIVIELGKAVGSKRVREIDAVR